MKSSESHPSGRRDRQRSHQLRTRPVLDLKLTDTVPVVGWSNIARAAADRARQKARARVEARSGEAGPGGEAGSAAEEGSAGSKRFVADSESGGTVIAFDCYQGVNVDEICATCEREIDARLVVDTRTLLQSEERLHALLSVDLTDDPVFGVLTRRSLEEFFDATAVRRVREIIHSAAGTGPVVVAGPGATLVVPDATVVAYADMPRREIQLLQRDHAEGNLGFDNRNASPKALYKQSFFVDWRVLDRWKQRVIPKSDFFLSAASRSSPVMIPTRAFYECLDLLVERPLMLKPFFDPGVWGGQWMRERFSLAEDAPNYAWCFNCVPEEQSIVVRAGGVELELPAVDLVFFRPDELLGSPVRSRFGREFPIRFDFLDTIGGQNLSLQVHPMTEYIQEHFGMHYTQDESYYILEAAADSRVYLGLKEGTRPEEMARDLRSAQTGGKHFDADRYVQSWPARKHDHFLIPAGTVHCSGANTMVLEISATPYIFTFKMWDWGRVDLDGKPRPVHLDHALANIQWNRTAEWVGRELVNRIESLADDGVGGRNDMVAPTAKGGLPRVERTGLHRSEFIETRRIWFSDEITLDTAGMEGGSVHVLNLVEGDEVLIEILPSRGPTHSTHASTPTGSADPRDEAAPPDRKTAGSQACSVRFAETVVIPSAAGRYRVRAHGESPRYAILVAWVRHQGA